MKRVQFGRAVGILFAVALLMTASACVIPLGAPGMKLTVVLDTKSKGLALQDVALWTLTGTGPEGSTIPATSAAGGDLTVHGLIPGTWTLTITGADDSGTTVAQGTATAELLAGIDNQVTITVASAGGTGSVDILVTGTGIARTVALSAAGGAVIHYTTDGSEPSEDSAVYSSAITIAGVGVSKTIRAVAVTGSTVGAESSQTVAIGTLGSWSLDGGSATVLAGSDDYGSDDGAVGVATFDETSGMATDGTYLYVADYGANTIRRILISTGYTDTLAGTAGPSASVDGTGAAARFNGPNNLTTDGIDLFVAEYDNDTIRRINLTSGVVTTLAGLAGVAGDTDGIGSAARFNGPCGLVTDGTDLFVTEYDGHVIRRVHLATGEVTTFAGQKDVSGDLDGTGTAATFSGPVDVCTDGTNLYVIDSDAGLIRKIVISTREVTTIAGTGEGGQLDGPGSEATFEYLSGIATDGKTLWIADDGKSSLIRAVDLTDGVYTVSTPAGNYTGQEGDAFYGVFSVVTDGHAVYVSTDDSTVDKLP